MITPLWRGDWCSTFSWNYVSNWKYLILFSGQCRTALGMEEGKIPDHAISASSSYETKSVGPQNARWVHSINHFKNLIPKSLQQIGVVCLGNISVLEKTFFTRPKAAKLLACVKMAVAHYFMNDVYPHEGIFSPCSISEDLPRPLIGTVIIGNIWKYVCKNWYAYNTWRKGEILSVGIIKNLGGLYHSTEISFINRTIFFLKISMKIWSISGDIL